MGFKYNQLLLCQVYWFAHDPIGMYIPYNISFKSCFELAIREMNTNYWGWGYQEVIKA